MTSTSHSRGLGPGLALLSAATFSTSGSFARSLLSAGWSPGAAVTARVTLAALMLAIPTLWSLRGRWEVVRRNSALILTYGVVAVAGGQLMYFNAVEHLSVGVALLLEYLGAVLVVGWMWLRHGQRPRRLTLIGSVVAMLGLVFVLDLAGNTRLDPIGVLWGLAAAVGLATYYVLSAKGDDDMEPLVIAGAGMAVASLTLLIAGGVGILPVRATFRSVEFAGRTVSWIVPVLGLSLVAAAIAYVVGIGAARILGPRLSSFIGLTEVVFAVFFAWLFLNELPTSTQLMGGAFIVGGVVLVHVDEMRAPGSPAIATTEAAAEVTPRAA